MICPVCGIESRENICEECSSDIKLHTRLLSISTILYNKGLDQANAGNLTGAIESLSHSIQFDKDNYIARNLLGLVYYAVGRLGDALKQWVISSSIVRDDNPAKGYIDTFQEESRAVDKMNDACRLYNQAIEYLRSKNEDMAIIRLKKAIEMSPGFIDAINLLCFCYLMKKDSGHALALAERAIQIDIRNERALHYYNLITGKYRPDSKKSRIDVKNESVTKFTPFDAKAANKARNLHISDIVCFVIGALAALAVCYYLVLPEMQTENEQAVNTLKTEHQQTINGYISEIAVKDGLLGDKDLEIERLKADNAELTKTNEVHVKVQRINTAYSLFQQGKTEEALQIVNSIETSNLPVDAIDLHTSIREQAYPMLEKQYYDLGLSSYNAKDYAAAADAFLNSEKFMTDGSETIDDAYYYLGRSLEAQSKPEEARSYYQKIIDSYPSSNHFNNAKNRLRNL